MTRFALVLCLPAVPLLGGDAGLKTALKGVESHYNRAKTLQVSFNETYTSSGRPRQSESGQLILRKPGRMRWDYTEPPGKLFLSDGKQVYLYTPQTKRVERMPLKESDDMRAPLAFLLGKLDFSKEFKDFRMRADGPDVVIDASAKSDKLPYDSIEMTVTPASEIRRLVVTGQDKSVLTFTFTGEKVNPLLNDAEFKFQMPPGAALAAGESNP